MAQEDQDDASQIGQAAALRSDVGDDQRPQGVEGVGQEADAGQGREGISPQKLAATKEQPSALDGYERAKPGEPIFTLQGGDPLAVEMTKEYISRRRRAALEIEDSQKQEAELMRCMEAERTLWAMQEYLRSGKAAQVDERAALSEPAAIDLHDRRVRAAGKVSYMRGDLEEMLVELLPDWTIAGGIEESEALLPMLCNAIDRLDEIWRVIEPRRMMLEPYPKIG